MPSRPADSPGGPVVAVSRPLVSFAHGHLSVLCHRFQDRPPILAIWTEDVSVLLSPEDGCAASAANELAEAVHTYATALADWSEWQPDAAPGVTP